MSGQWAELGDLSAPEPRSITDGPFGSNLKTSHYTNDGPRVVRLQNIGDGRFIDDQAHISEEHFSRLQNHSVRPGDVLIASLGKELPRACLAPDWLGPAIVKADCIRFRAGPRVDGRFVAHMLNSQPVRKSVAEIIHGVGRPRLNLREIKAIRLPVPPLNEQQRIVEVIEEQFSRLDAGVESLQRAKRNLTRFRASLLQAAIDDASVGGQLVRVDQIAQIQLGRQRSPRHHAGTHMRPYLRAANVTWGGISLFDVKEMDFQPEDFARFQLAAGDILLNEASGSPNEVGKPAIWDGSIPDVCFQNTLLRVRPGESVDRRFLHLVFYAAASNGGFAKVARGVNIMHLGKAGLASWQVPVPPVRDQHRIVADVERQFSIIDAMAKTIDGGLIRAGILRRLILHQAFAGRLLAISRGDLPTWSHSRLLD